MERVNTGKLTHKDSMAKTGMEKVVSDTSKHGTVVGWLLWYAAECGQDCPERACVVLPHVEIKHMHSEYLAEMTFLGKDKLHVASLPTFYKVWATDPQLECYKISSLKHNFERCDTCVKFATYMTTCHPTQREYWRNRRSKHLLLCRSERIHYGLWCYQAEMGKVTSIVIDGWSIWTTTAPRTTQQIKGIGGLPGLQLKVTAAIVHGDTGNRLSQFYISDPTVAHDSNLNIEVLRRVLLSIVAKGGSISPTLHIQADNAGGAVHHNPSMC